MLRTSHARTVLSMSAISQLFCFKKSAVAHRLSWRFRAGKGQTVCVAVCLTLFFAIAKIGRNKEEHAVVVGIRIPRHVSFNYLDSPKPQTQTVEHPKSEALTIPAHA